MHLALAVSSHLREVSRGEPVEAELEAEGLGEVAFLSQVDCLTGRWDRPASLKHFCPPVRHG